jgi:hypothetical protein
MTWARLAFKLQPSSIGFATLVCLGLAALAGWLTLSLPAQLAECASRTSSQDCGTVSLFGSPLGDAPLMVNMAIAVAMYAVPVVLGATILPGEIERRTAMIAWPLARSRSRWLAWRAGWPLVIGILLVGVMAIAAEMLGHAQADGSDTGFLLHGTRGISLVTRAALMFAVALAVGAIVGRLLPALLVSAAVALTLSVILTAFPPYGVESVELTEADANRGYPFTTDVGYRSADGRPIGEDEANEISQAAFAEYSPDFPPDSILPYTVSYGIASTRYGEVLARESAVLLGAAVLAGLTATLVVQRRAPDR